MTLAKKRVFLSFRAEDKNQVNGLRLLAANDKFDIEFYDESVRSPYNSFDAVYIKRKIRAKINRTSVTVCMLSALTHTSPWVEWELLQSYEKQNTVIYMGFKDGPSTLVIPKPGRDCKATWYLWDHELLDRLITDAETDLRHVHRTPLNYQPTPAALPASGGIAGLAALGGGLVGGGLGAALDTRTDLDRWLASLPPVPPPKNALTDLANLAPVSEFGGFPSPFETNLDWLLRKR
jgi:MTH538 TIR-like domain (DUF1863)